MVCPGSPDDRRLLAEMSRWVAESLAGPEHLTEDPVNPEPPVGWPAEWQTLSDLDVQIMGLVRDRWLTRAEIQGSLGAQAESELKCALRFLVRRNILLSDTSKGYRLNIPSQGLPDNLGAT